MSPPTTKDRAEPRGTGVAIRPLRTHEDLLACVALQKEVWGEEFQECVAPALLKVSARVGGILAGAVDGEGRLLGFVYGLTGLTGGRRIHWSHMLGVSPAARGLGIGRRLKEYQREKAAAAGAKLISWTFDPLVARNAHLNLNLLGAEVSEYVADMYPPMASKLHGTIPLDRFVVLWPTDPDGAAPSSSEEVPGWDSGDGAVVLDWRSWNGDGEAGVRRSLSGASAVRVVIPRDFDDLVQSAPKQAHSVRSVTRRFFEVAQAEGLRIAAFRRAHGGRDPHYVLVRS